jgi:hypothetical protein
VANVVINEDVWRARLDEELRQLIDDMLHTEKTHMATAERLQRIHSVVGGASAMLSAAAGTTIFADGSSLAAGLLALAAALASGVMTFMRPQSKAEQHLGAGRQLAALRVQARHLLELDVHRLPVDELRNVLAEIAEHKANIDAASPGTLTTDYETARLRIVAGTFDRDRAGGRSPVGPGGPSSAGTA